MSRRAKASEFVEKLVPPAPPAPDEVAAKGLNLIGDVHELAIENPVAKAESWVSKLGNWLRSRTQGNL